MDPWTHETHEKGLFRCLRSRGQYQIQKKSAQKKSKTTKMVIKITYTSDGGRKYSHIRNLCDANWSMSLTRSNPAGDETLDSSF